MLCKVSDPCLLRKVSPAQPQGAYKAQQRLQLSLPCSGCSTVQWHPHNATSGQHNRVHRDALSKIPTHLFYSSNIISYPCHKLPEITVKLHPILPGALPSLCSNNAVSLTAFQIINYSNGLLHTKLTSYSSFVTSCTREIRVQEKVQNF